MIQTLSACVVESTRISLLSPSIRTPRAGTRPYTGIGRGSKFDPTSTQVSILPHCWLSRERDLPNARN